MDTSAIIYRVADFLKTHPPFNAMGEHDLLEFASRGRVRFHEANDYLLWQGEPNRFKVFVIQQGTVSLWDEQGERAELRDVRGVGDMLGVEQFAGADRIVYSARASSDVLIYTFSAFDFEALVLKHPYAQQYVSAYETVTADTQVLEQRRDPHMMFLHELAGHQSLRSCGANTSIRDAAMKMRSCGVDAMVVLDADERPAGVLTTDALITWIGAGACDGGQPVATLLQGPPPAIAPAASVADGILTMAAADEQSVAMTSDGTSQGRIHAILSARDFSSVFGDQPVAMLREIRYATGTGELRTLNQRVRAFAHQYLTGGSSVEWVARFVHLADVGIVRRLIALAGHDSASGCWCFCGSSGREEAITRLAPLVILIHDDRSESVRQGAHQRVWEALVDCDYLPRRGLPFESSFYAASLDDWTKRYHGWMHDPIMNQLYSARAMLDLRPIEGRRDLWHAIAETVKVGATRNFLRVLANDCLDNLPPLTFFQDAVVDESGTHSHVFELQRSALNPLVDVGRVFGAAAGKVLGSSTLERFTMARALLPDHESIFREASETLRVVLWQQGRIGIGQGTDGADLPPALLGRYDRHVLRSGFRSISRLIEFTADGHWLDTR